MRALPGGSWFHLLDAVTAQGDISAGHGDIVRGTQPSSRSQLLMLFNCLPLSVHFSPHGYMGMSQQHHKDQTWALCTLPWRHGGHRVPGGGCSILLLREEAEGMR